MLGPPVVLQWLYGSLGDKEGAFPLAYVEPCDDDDYYDDDEFDEDVRRSIW